MTVTPVASKSRNWFKEIFFSIKFICFLFIAVNRNASITWKNERNPEGKTRTTSRESWNKTTTDNNRSSINYCCCSFYYFICLCKNSTIINKRNWTIFWCAFWKSISNNEFEKYIYAIKQFVSHLKFLWYVFISITISVIYVYQ